MCVICVNVIFDNNIYCKTIIISIYYIIRVHMHDVIWVMRMHMPAQFKKSLLLKQIRRIVIVKVPGSVTFGPGRKRENKGRKAKETDRKQGTF